jgi:hypothetical protein
MRHLRCLQPQHNNRNFSGIQRANSCVRNRYEDSDDLEEVVDDDDDDEDVDEEELEEEDGEEGMRDLSSFSPIAPLRTQHITALQSIQKSASKDQ